MMRHTLGLRVVERKSVKWDEAGDHAIVDREGKIVGEAFATVDHWEKRPAKANAHLWAASPQMYEAAKAVLAAFEAGVFVRNTKDDGDADWAIKALPHLQALAQLQQAVESVKAGETSDGE